MSADRSAPPKPALDYSLAALRDTDRDRYLACLLSPSDKRESLAALYAFYAEIARIRDAAREPLPGEIRLQWWRDALDRPEAGEGHPLAQALLQTIDRHHLPVAVLHAMIDARVFDLYDDPMDSTVMLEGYAGETASALLQLASLVLDPETARASTEAAGHAGVAQTIAGVLLLAPLHRRRGQVYFPADLLSATGLDREEFLAGQDIDAVARAVRALCGLGRDHVARARSHAASIAPGNRAAYVTLSLVEPVLARAERAGHTVFDHPIQPAQWRRQWWMWRASRTGRW